MIHTNGTNQGDLTEAIAGKMTESSMVVSGNSSSSSMSRFCSTTLAPLGYVVVYSSSPDGPRSCVSWPLLTGPPGNACLTVACSYTLGGRADLGDDGSDGRSTLVNELDVRFVEIEDAEVSARPEPFISHVNGGPETLIELLARPIVRPACRTVPKSHRSSGSPLAGLCCMCEMRG